MKVGDDNPKYKGWFLVKVQQNYMFLNVLTTIYRYAVIKTTHIIKSKKKYEPLKDKGKLNHTRLNLLFTFVRHFL